MSFTAIVLHVAPSVASVAPSLTNVIVALPFSLVGVSVNSTSTPSIAIASAADIVVTDGFNSSLSTVIVMSSVRFTPFTFTVLVFMSPLYNVPKSKPLSLKVITGVSSPGPALSVKSSA